jgi:hypothetical protein
MADVLVKGGTSTASYDKEQAIAKADAEARRDHQDKLRDIAERPGTGEDIAIARLGEQKLINSESPRLLFQYMYRDKTIKQECIGEITVGAMPDGTIDPMFTIVCPRCLGRGVAMEQAQVLVRNSHRKFHLDERKAGLRIVETPWGNVPLNVAGVVTVQDKIRCSNFNCDWVVRIDESQVFED